MPTLEEIMNAGQMQAQQAPQQSRKQRIGQSLSDIGLGLMANGDERFTGIAHGIQMGRQRKSDAEEKRRADANMQFKRGLGMMGLEEEVAARKARAEEARATAAATASNNALNRSSRETIAANALEGRADLAGRRITADSNRPDSATTSGKDWQKIRELTEQYGAGSVEVEQYKALAMGGNQPGNRERALAGNLYRSIMTNMLANRKSQDAANKAAITAARQVYPDFLPNMILPEEEAPAPESPGIMKSIVNFFGDDSDSPVAAPVEIPQDEPAPDTPIVSDPHNPVVIDDSIQREINAKLAESYTREEIIAELAKSGISAEGYKF